MGDAQSPAFYLPAGQDSYVPTESTASAWDISSQHGGPTAALLATCIDDVAGGPGMRLARISVDFLGPIPRREFTVETKVTRGGKRIRRSAAAMLIDGVPVAEASAWHITTGSRPPHLPVVPEMPPPLPAAHEQRYFVGAGPWGHIEDVEWRFCEGGWDRPGPVKVWARPKMPLLPGRPYDGFQTAIMVADSTNGLSNELPIEDWLFIPPTLTVTLARHSAGEWIYLDAHTSFAADGIALAQSRIADTEGFLGVAAQPLLVSSR